MLQVFPDVELLLHTCIWLGVPIQGFCLLSTTLLQSALESIRFLHRDGLFWRDSHWCSRNCISYGSSDTQSTKAVQDFSNTACLSDPQGGEGSHADSSDSRSVFTGATKSHDASGSALFHIWCSWCILLWFSLHTGISSILQHYSPWYIWICYVNQPSKARSSPESNSPAQTLTAGDGQPWQGEDSAPGLEAVRCIFSSENLLDPKVFYGFW